MENDDVYVQYLPNSMFILVIEYTVTNSYSTVITSLKNDNHQPTSADQHNFLKS